MRQRRFIDGVTSFAVAPPGIERINNRRGAGRGRRNLGYRRKLDERYSLTLTGQNLFDTARQVTVVDMPVLRDRIRQKGLGAIVTLGLTINLGSQTGRRRPEPASDFDQGAGPAG